MSRAAVPGLPSRYPIGELLPALYADDDLAQRFTAGLDTVLAPVLSTLDNLPAYFDPALAPADFLPWLATWVGVDIDRAWPQELQRAVVARAVELHRWRGTRRGLVEHLRLCFGVHADVRDGGGVAWSAGPGTELPPAPTGELLVRVWPVAPGATVDASRVLDVVTASCPVHLTCRVEILPGPPAEAPRTNAETGG
ncbi:phage tail protein I [Streptomyces microflavus]|uniref:Phage tail protein I n=1 Tax=Streptomyces microflavus TaxID=1919 RepID=A0A6N9VBQ1_STRMI|nr:MULTISPECIES: phage tail protein I [Streptomyces]MBK3586157.1 phage tail protein I [Streptomyces sp. MBT57]MBW3361296.1 phage tail protein I [Streptomyces sp. 09ZI22]MEE1733691.1 phage tail protein I [Streptomyces sp. BE282]NEB68529.1 phage tail protein I [Streptomyces microflavus]OXY85240.1 phage tail protein I [Streptomyces sp. 2R]